MLNAAGIDDYTLDVTGNLVLLVIDVSKVTEENMTDFYHTLDNEVYLDYERLQ